MARFNTGARTLTITGNTILTYAFTGGIISLTGSPGYGLTLATPVSFPGFVQQVYNATNGDCTILSAAGSLRGAGFTTNTQQIIPSGAWYTVVSNGTDYVISNVTGGPLLATSGTFSSTLTANHSVSLSPANQTVTISPSGTGTVTVAPATTGSINNVAIGASTRSTGAFTTLDANAAVGLSPANATVTISPSGTGTVTMAPATTGNINNVAIGASTRSTGAFTTLAANSTVTLTGSTNSTSPTTGQVQVTGGAGISLDLWVGGLIDAGSIQDTPIGTVTRNSGAFTTLAANNTVVMTANTTSSSTTTGTLQVTGGTGITENLWVGGIFRVNSSTASNATNTGCAVFAGGIGIAGQMTATTIVETSSIAFKENVNPIEDALNKIMQLVGVTYDRKDMDKHEAGLIAEDVNKIIPELVSKDANGNPHGIQYSKLTAYLIEAVKSLKNEIDTLKGNNR